MYFSTTKFVLAMTLLLSFALHGLPSCSATRLLQTGGLKYLEQPEVAWQAQADIILKGNGVFTSPDDKISVVTQSFGKITAFDTKNGTMLWSFTPPVNSGRPTSCQGGATFSMNGPSDYIVYSVVDEPNGIRPVT